jgi:hypothetical protein
MLLIKNRHFSDNTNTKFGGLKREGEDSFVTEVQES